MKEMAQEGKFSLPHIPVEEMDAFYEIDKDKIPTDRPYIWSMFVMTADGIISYNEPDYPDEDIGLLGAGIAGKHFGNRGAEADWRLLQHGWAVADAIVAGSGILKAKPDITWMPVDEDLKDVYNDLQKERPALKVIITGRGFSREDLERYTVFKKNKDFETLVAVTETGLDKMAKDLGELKLGAQFLSFGEDRVDMVSLVRFLRKDRGVKLLDLQGGSTVLGQFLKAGLVDESRYTISPQIAGSNNSKGERRPSSADTYFSPEDSPRLGLMKLKTLDSYIFTRYKVLKNK